MKFRIIKDGGYYVPQRKWLFWWIEIDHYDFELGTNINLSFETLQQAVDFVNGLQRKIEVDVVWKKERRQQRNNLLCIVAWFIITTGLIAAAYVKLVERGVL